MLHFSGLEVQDIIDKLHDETCAKGADECTDADRAAEQPADQEYNAPLHNFHDPDRDPGQALAETDKKGVSRAAALPAAHIDPHADRHEDKSNKHDHNTCGETGVFRKRIQVIEHLDKVSGQQCIDDRAISDPFFQKKVNEQDHDRHGRHGKAII